jgi:UDP-glucose 4-epimerase
MSRDLVTGGAGFIGSHLVDRLLAEGHAVTVLDDFSTGRRENLVSASAAGDLRVVEGSILDPEVVAEAMSGCTRVFHLAVQCVRRSLGLPLENHEINATGTINVLEAARRQGVKRFIYCSSSEVYGNASNARLSETRTVCAPVTVYGAAKLAGEYYTLAYQRTYGLPVVVVRPFNAYGPREHDRGDLAEVIPRFVIRVLNGLPPAIFGSGEQGRDFTFVTDVASGLASAADCRVLLGSTVNIAFGRMITIREIAEAVTGLCQRPDLAPLHLEGRPGDVFALHADIGLAERAMGYRASVPFEEGLEKYIGWFSETYPDPKLLLEDDVRNWDLPE